MSPWWRRVAETWHPIFRSVTCSNITWHFFMVILDLNICQPQIYIYIYSTCSKSACKVSMFHYLQPKERPIDQVILCLKHPLLSPVTISSRDTSHCRIGMHLQKSRCAWSFFGGAEKWMFGPSSATAARWGCRGLDLEKPPFVNHFPIGKWWVFHIYVSLQ